MEVMPINMTPRDSALEMVLAVNYGDSCQLASWGILYTNKFNVILANKTILTWPQW